MGASLVMTHYRKGFDSGEVLRGPGSDPARVGSRATAGVAGGEEHLVLHEAVGELRKQGGLVMGHNAKWTIPVQPSEGFRVVCDCGCWDAKYRSAAAAVSVVKMLNGKEEV